MSHQRCSIKIDVHKTFAKFTVKHLCWSLFVNKVAGFQPTNFRNSFFTGHFWATAFVNRMFECSNVLMSDDENISQFSLYITDRGENKVLPSAVRGKNTLVWIYFKNRTLLDVLGLQEFRLIGFQVCKKLGSTLLFFSSVTIYWW